MTNIIDFDRLKAILLPGPERRKRIADLLQHRRDLERVLDHLAALDPEAKAPLAGRSLILGQRRAANGSIKESGVLFNVRAYDLCEWIMSLIEPDEEQLRVLGVAGSSGPASPPRRPRRPVLKRRTGHDDESSIL